MLKLTVEIKGDLLSSDAYLNKVAMRRLPAGQASKPEDKATKWEAEIAAGDHEVYWEARAIRDTSYTVAFTVASQNPKPEEKPVKWSTTAKTLDDDFGQGSIVVHVGNP